MKRATEKTFCIAEFGVQKGSDCETSNEGDYKVTDFFDSV
jgi:hypothetical protein